MEVLKFQTGIGSKKSLGLRKNYGSEEILGPSKFRVRKKVWKIVGLKKLGVHKNFRSEKKFWLRKKAFGYEKSLVWKNFWFAKFFESDKIAGPQILGPKNFGPNLLSNNILVHKNYDPKKLDSKSLVKIAPATAEILVIWTNVAGAYVAWTNIIMTIGIF